MAPLTTEMIMVMATIAVVIFLFVVEWIRVDVVAILMMVVLASVISAVMAARGVVRGKVTSILREAL